MKGVEGTYLGWRELVHAQGCKRPNWEVQLRVDQSVSRDRYNGHSCPDEDCHHGNTFDETTARLVCRSCGNAHQLKAEVHSERNTTTSALGYGLPPQKAGGLLLWAGDPWWSHGRLSSEHPHDFLVTRYGVTKPTADDVVGTITLGRGKRGATVWTAAAVPDPDGEYGAAFATGSLRWKHVQEGHRTTTAAARWIAAQHEAGDA